MGAALASFGERRLMARAAVSESGKSWCLKC